MQSKYVDFFTKLPKTAQLTFRMLPNKYEVIDTELFSALCVQQGIVKKIVVDNIKESYDKVINTMLKQDGAAEKKYFEYEDIKLSDEFEEFLDNYLFFIRSYKQKIDSELLTQYVTYLLLSNKSLKSYIFFENALFNNAAEKARKDVLTFIVGKIGNPMSSKLCAYGEYLINPLMIKHRDCFGREVEIEKSIKTLCQMKKSNVLLVGNTGVGKTSVVYGICNYIQSDKCPKQLEGKCVFSLDTNKLVSGTTYRGDLEKRLQELISELESHKNIILFIDEIHTLFTSGTGDSDSVPIESVLKNFLSRESIVIGCTTEKEYRKIETDKAFERRFQKIHIAEPTKEVAFEIVKNSKNAYEKFHDVTVSDSVCQCIIDMCDLYIRNRYFPDKALDILDKVCVQAKLSGCDPDNKLVSNLIMSYLNMEIKDQQKPDIDKITKDIKASIIGQDEAVDTMMRYIKRYFVGLNNVEKPIASVLFVGSTGTGKTELSKLIAKHIFSDESFIRLDMSEFMESHSVSKIIGSPPGYVGFHAGGALTEHVKHNPFSVILLDEIEKAHKDVLNVFLQIMDCGRLTEANGETVDFRNCLIIMTSNLGCKEYLETKQIGFTETEFRESAVTNAVNNFLSPEFRNRLDSIIMFKPITKELSSRIFNLKLSKISQRYMEKLRTKILFSDKALDFMCENSFDRKNGVRFIERNIESYLDDLILNSDKFGCFENNSINVKLKNNKLYLEVTSHEKQSKCKHCKESN